MTDYYLFFYLVFFALGAIIGSFLNVVILRFNTGRPVATGRSACLSCSKKLRWFELLPIVSFFILRGRCRSCGSHISWQYPLVEIMTALMFSLSWWRFGGNLWELSFYLLILSLAIVIAIYDWRHKIIPDLFVYLLILLGLLKTFWLALPVLITNNSFVGINDEFMASIFGGLIFGGIFGSVWLLSKGQWLGFGDVKLALAIGLLLGVSEATSAIILAVWIGALVGLILIWLGRTKLFGGVKSFTIKSEIPFAPFLLLGLVLTIFFNFNVLSF